jgi:hypothetical protein
MLLFVFVPAALAAQSVVNVPTSQCVWRAGDDPAWAAPGLDETGWQPYAPGKQDDNQPRLWVRCHADLSSLEGAAQPAIQIAADSSYQIFFNGQLLGGSGDLSRGNFSINAIRSYPFSSGLLQHSPITLALRLAITRNLTQSGPIHTLLMMPLRIRAGDAALLDDIRAREILTRTSGYALTATCYSIIGVIALMMLGLFFSDRSRIEILLLSLSGLSLAVLRLNEFSAAALLNYSFLSCLAVILLGNISLTFTQVPFYYALARRRVPIAFWMIMPSTVLTSVPAIVGVLPIAHQPEWWGLFGEAFLRPLGLVVHITLEIAPFIAFWPYAKIARGMRPLAALCMVWAAVDIVWFLIEITALRIPGIPDLFAIWGVVALDVRAFTTTCVLAALLILFLHEQRQIFEERAHLSGEVQAACNVQQYLIPDHLPATPGFRLESAYHPAREVGGDFFQVLPQPADGSVLIIVGDVAGKGVEAGMLATLIVGAVRTAAAFTSDPSRILALLNDRLRGRGLVTCLALRIEQDGNATLVNAGHLPPYLNGKEMAVEGALPLGAIPGTQFPALRFQLEESDLLVLITDGVVEARSKTGELFGFERTAAISTQSAEQIAHAAQAFGQEDDITVLTITLAGVPAHA